MNNGEDIQRETETKRNASCTNRKRPTYPGEFFPSQNVYVLSYPGIAFSFRIPDSSAHKLQGPDAEFISYLSSNDAPNCTSMALFRGQSWTSVKDGFFEARHELDTGNNSKEMAIYYVDVDVSISEAKPEREVSAYHEI